MVESAAKVRSRYARASFLMKRTAKVIPCGYISDMIHAIGVKRLKQKSNLTET